MVTGTVTNFTDPLPFQRALPAGDFELLPTTRGAFRGKLVQAKLNKIWMTRGQENLPRVLIRSTTADRATIAFHTDCNQPRMHHCGADVAHDALIVNNSSVMHRRTYGASRWGSMSLAPEELASASRVICGHELDVSQVAPLVHPGSALMGRLLDLHRQLGGLVEESDEKLANVEVVRAIDDELAYLMVRCLDEGLPVTTTQAERNHSRIIRRFEEFLRENLLQPLYVAEICAATGACERSLRACCLEHFGMGPVHYLWLRRMHLVRRTLLLATPETATVTRTAMDHGFWELGRFSTQYRSLFGEPASATLQRSPPPGLIFH
ncbi:helix-turn-helix domain-containing protein [Bradyrhizobium sp. CSA112]|uniref:helix-turn-helix domain-containing protein n=1 Tax=Bradyrhizobium sp. CSA112 TaxID=2699170 RepID=UPI0023AF4997|nr:helix-turn-helix domain-containing protein [Bradyrhizobium sp. CSA112]MDE5451395.1 helix-turn-helix domain-containing protein [Bradyrhizobium sp. CSA112]